MMIKNVTGSIGVATLAIVIGLVAPDAAFAANAGCATSSTPSTPAALGSFGATQGTGVGCWGIDQTFSAFTVTGNATLVNTDISGTTSYPGSLTVNSPWNVADTLTGNAGGAITETGGGGTTLTGSVGLTTNSNNQFGFNSSYVPPTGQNGIYITGTTLSEIGTTGANANDTITVTEVLCAAATCTTGATSNEITLTVQMAGNGVSTETTHTCALVGTGSNAACVAGQAGVTFNLHIPTVTIVSETYSLVVHGGSTTDTLTSFTNTWTNEELTPEPSTFVLMGAALIGVAALRFRKQKQQA